MTLNRRRTLIIGISIGILMLWFNTAYTVFAYRHPWMTRTEISLHFKEVMTFKRVPKGELE